jgi:cell division septation protein DedD
VSKGLTVAHARVLAAPPIGVAFWFSIPLLFAMAHEARAERAPAAVEYASVKPQQVAALDPAKPIVMAKTTRGALTSYGYGAAKAPASGPTIDLRGAFGDAPVAAPRVSYAPPLDIPDEPRAAPAAMAAPPAAGPLDISPPMPQDADLLGAADEAPLEASAPAASIHGLYLVQVGAFAVRANAERTRERAQSVGAVLVDTVARPAGALYRVRIGPWPSRDAAEEALSSAIDLGFTDARVTTGE